MFIVLVSFNSPFATKCVSLNDEPYMVRPTLIDLNAVELKHYLFMISLDKSTRYCSVLSLKTRVPEKKKTKDINVKLSHFDVPTRKFSETSNKHEKAYVLIFFKK